MEQLLSPKSCSFGVLFTLKFFRGTVGFGSSHFYKRIYFKHHVFVKKIDFFQNNTFNRPFSIVHFQSSKWCVISLSFVVSRCHLLSLDVPLTRLSFYKRSFFFDSCKLSDLRFLLTTMILISVQKQPSEEFSEESCS